MSGAAALIKTGIALRPLNFFSFFNERRSTKLDSYRKIAGPDGGPATWLLLECGEALRYRRQPLNVPCLDCAPPRTVLS
jgi:hypothetical protein